jgi:hypothetical protein
MMRPLETLYRGRVIVLECVHKKQFPPPQMYGSTPDDIDILWRQGSINATQYQLLKTWQERCNLMVMGPRCLDCPLALKQNPRPGRPNVIETEPWLAAKKRMYWEDMKAGKVNGVGTGEIAAVDPPDLEEPEPEEPEPEELDEPDPEDPEETEEPETPEESPNTVPTAEETSFVDDLPPSTPASEKEVSAEEEVADDDDIINALAKER